MCAITGMPALTIASIVGAKCAPPSSLTPAQRVSFMIRPAILMASSMPVWYDMNGRSTMTGTRSVARQTARPMTIISSTVVSFISGWPSRNRLPLSPTRNMSGSAISMMAAISYE